MHRIIFRHNFSTKPKGVGEKTNSPMGAKTKGKVKDESTQKNEKKKTGQQI